MVTIVFTKLVPRPPRSTLFPYTTLFRSGSTPSNWNAGATTAARGASVAAASDAQRKAVNTRTSVGMLSRAKTRSEEHTSELQSHSDLVCRLLLEKKKKKIKNLKT